MIDENPAPWAVLLPALAFAAVVAVAARLVIAAVDVLDDVIAAYITGRAE